MTSPTIPGPVDSALLRRACDDARAQVRRGLLEGASGWQLCGDFSAAVRREVGTALEAGLEGWDPDMGRVALLEIGSLARDQLCPFADVDLVVLCEASLEEDPRFEGWMRGVLHPLWDAGVKLTSVVQTPEAWLDAAATDLSLCTALLDARTLAGDEALLASVQATARARFMGDRRLGLLMRVRADMERRFTRYGGTVYTVEPDLKSGAGGTRDLAALQWAFSATYGSADFDTLVNRGVLRRRSANVLTEASEVLLRLRCALHLAAGRGQDRLVFQYQDVLLPLLGAAEADGPEEITVAAIERYMQAFHNAANLALRFGRREFRRCLPPRLGPRLDRRIDERFRAVDHRLVYDGAAVFAETPALALQALTIARDHGLSVGARAVDAIVDGAGDPRAARLSSDPEAHRWFMNLLTDPRDAGAPTPLERCHEYGLLERVVPEFAPCRSRMQYESFHAYTVDQHSLYVVEFLKSLVRGEYRKDYPLATAVHLGIDDPRPLYLAALMHDAGKPHGDQCEVGATLALQVATRLGFAPDTAARVAKLVAMHLEMPMLSQRRDLGDAALIRGFAQQVGDRRLLSELYLLSLADMAAVGPGYLSSWKATLLDELYLLAAAHLSGEVHRRSLGQRSRADEPEGLPERYYALYDLGMRQTHRALLDRMRANDTQVALDVRSGAGGVLRLTVAARDQPGLLAHIAAELDEVGVEVREEAPTTLLPLRRSVWHLAMAPSQARVLWHPPRWPSMQRWTGILNVSVPVTVPSPM